MPVKQQLLTSHGRWQWSGAAGAYVSTLSRQGYSAHVCLKSLFSVPKKLASRLRLWAVSANQARSAPQSFFWPLRMQAILRGRSFLLMAVDRRNSQMAFANTVANSVARFI